MSYKQTPDNRLEGYVREVDFELAYTVLTANSAETPVDLQLATNTLLGRLTGNIAALTGTQAAGIIPHNSLSGLQGGQSNEYYHLTAAEYSGLQTTFDDCYNNEGGAPTVIVDAGDVTFDLDGDYSFIISLLNTTNTGDGFQVNNNADYFQLNRIADNQIALVSELQTLDINIANVFSIDGASASNVSVTGAGLTISTITSGTLAVNSAGSLVFSDGNKSGSTYSGAFDLSSASSDWDDFEVNFGEVSLLEALNALGDLAGLTDLDDAYNNHGGAAGISVDAGSVTWTLDSTYDFIIDLTSAAVGSRGFLIEETTGSDYIRAETESETGDYINWTAEVRQINFNSNQFIYLNSEQKIALNATDTDSPVLIGTTSTSGDQGNLVIQATSADGSTYAQVWKDSGAASIATLNSDGDFVSAATISATTAKLSDLTDGYLPYHVSDAAGLANSGIFWDNGNSAAGIGTATPTDKLSIRDNSTTGVPSLGAELLTNGGFDSDLSSWTAGANWAWNAGTALHTAGATATIYQGIATTANEHYYVEVVITGRTAGSVVMTLQNSTESFTLSANMTYKYSFKAGTTATNNLIFTPQSTFDGAIDSVIAKVIVPASTYAFALYDSGGTITNTAAIAIDSSMLGLASGVGAAANKIDGSYWTAIGVQSGGKNSVGGYWTSIGSNAAANNTVGSNWTAIGYAAGYQNTIGAYWSAIGPYAGYASTTSSEWTAIGYRAGYSNSTGENWIAIGSRSGYGNINGTEWAAIGYRAGYANTGSSNWIAIGGYSGYSNSSGGGWTAIGRGAAYSNTSGTNFVALGSTAARFIDGGGNNTTCTEFVCLGYDTRLSADGTSNEIVIGTQAIGVGSNSVVLGNSSITTTILRGNTAIGTTDLDGTPAIGRLVVKGSTNDGSTNCLVLRDSDEANVLWFDTNGDIHTDKWLDQDSNTFLGVDVAGNGALAHSAGNDGYMNTGLGNGALYSISTGYSNIGLGYQTLYANTTSDYNSAMGHRALYYITGGSNTALGAFAGYGASGSTAANNTCVGYYAGFALQTGGDNNTLLGYSAGDNITTGAGNIIIGVSVDAPSATADNQLNIGDAIFGDLSTGNVGIGAMPLTNMAAGDLLLEGGSLVLKEITTPTADANYGKVYTKSDNKLYFQDGSGTEHEISFV